MRGVMTSVNSWVIISGEQVIPACDGCGCRISGCGGYKGQCCLYLLRKILGLLDQCGPGL